MTSTFATHSAAPGVLPALVDGRRHARGLYTHLAPGAYLVTTLWPDRRHIADAPRRTSHAEFGLERIDVVVTADWT